LGPWREEDYRRGCRWAGDEKRGHCGQAAAGVPEKQARVDDCNDDGKADVEEEANGAKPGQFLEPLADEERKWIRRVASKE